jgi:endoglucanase
MIAALSPGCGSEGAPGASSGNANGTDVLHVEPSAESAGSLAAEQLGLQSAMSNGREKVSALTPERYTPIVQAKPTRGIALPIGKCLNYAGQLELDKDYDWIRPVVESDFQQIRTSGFSTLRLPINPARFASSSPPYAIDSAYLAEIDRVVSLATAAGLNVIVDNHVNQNLFVNPNAEIVRLEAIWRQLAEYFRASPSNVYFELINEPHALLDNRSLEAILPSLITIIRASNPTRPIIVGGERWSDVDSLETLELPDDPYIVPTFHYYTPMAFTHQGTSWTIDSSTGLPFPLGRTFGGLEDYEQLDADIQKVQRYISRTGRVPFVGEFGAYEKISVDQRAKYYASVTRGFASIGIQSCVWGYANNFPIRDWNGWWTPLIDALATTASTGEGVRPKPPRN